VPHGPLVQHGPPPAGCRAVTPDAGLVAGGGRHALLSEVYRAIVRADDAPQMFADACRIAVERGGFLMAWIGVVEGDRVVPVASHGAEQGYLQAIDISAGTASSGQGPTGTAAQTGGHDICPDIGKDPRMAPWRDGALARGYRSSGAFPLLVSDRAVAVLSVYAAEVGFADPEVVELLDHLADDMAFALEGFDRDARRQAAEDALRDLTVQLERSNEALQEFVYVASHDLSEPLRTVTGFVQLLEQRYRGRLDADADDFIRFAVDGCAHMQDLIDGLLTYSRVATKAEPAEPVDVADVVRQAVESLHARIEDTGAEVVVGDLPVVRADRVQLGQVFQNLLANAVKFVAPGVTPHVEVTADPLDGEWRFVVADNGIGVEPANRDRLFRMFSRLQARTAYPGSGIGLAVCRRIVERHGGRIWHEEDPGGGSRFCFTLPREDGAP